MYQVPYEALASRVKQEILLDCGKSDVLLTLHHFLLYFFKTDDNHDNRLAVTKVQLAKNE